MESALHLDESLKLGALFPDTGAVAVESFDPDDAAALLPEELRFTRTMAERRRRQFHHGRACARVALAKLGVMDRALPIGDGGQPVWPDGIVGSITHTDQTAAAVAARSADIASVGIDVESDEPLESELIPRICVVSELESMASEIDAQYHAKLVFSIKEAVYKCLWPHVRRFIDFTDVSVEIDSSNNGYLVRPTGSEATIAMIDRVRGRFERRNGHIFASAWIRK